MMLTTEDLHKKGVIAMGLKERNTVKMVADFWGCSDLHCTWKNRHAIRQNRQSLLHSLAAQYSATMNKEGK